MSLFASSSPLSHSALPVSVTSPLRYPGGKTRAVKVLTTFLPEPHPRRVLSPFLGGGSFELYLTGQGSQVVGYDAYQPLTNFWQHVLTRPGVVADSARQNLPVTAETFRALQHRLRTTPCTTVGDAAAYLTVNRSSFSGATLSGGFSAAAARGRLTDSILTRVSSFNNPHLTVRHGDYVDTLTAGVAAEYDFVFADPPYCLPAGTGKLYGSKGDMHTTFDHEHFHETVTHITVPWLITYNDTPELRRLYKDYLITPVSWSYGMNATKRSSEIVICNYVPPQLSQPSGASSGKS